MLLLLGHVGGLISVEQLSLLVSAVGVVLLLMGRRILRLVWMPLAYLLFMIPIWETVTDRFQWSFQLLSADVAAWLLRTFGIPVWHDGVYLHLPNVILQVAEACSGVNFVIAILAVSIPQAYLSLHSRRLCVLVAALSIIVALLTNGLRIAFIGVLQSWGWTGSDIHGPGHALQGLSVAVIGFVAMFVIIRLLAKRWGIPVGPETRADASAHVAAPPARVRLAPGLVAATCIIFMSAAGVQAISLSTPVGLSASLESFPAVIGHWRSRPSRTLSSDRVAAADAELSRDYYSTSGAVVHMYVGYFASQQQAKELVSDRMSALHRSATTVGESVDSRSLVANELTRDVSGRKQYVLFCERHERTSGDQPLRSQSADDLGFDCTPATTSAVVVLVAELPVGTDAARTIDETRTFGRLATTALRELPPPLT